MNHTADKQRTFSVTLLTPNGEFVIQVAAGEHIWDAAAAQGIKLPALCHQGWCLTCAASILGEDRNGIDQSDSVAFFPPDCEAGFALLCTAKPCANLKLLTNQATAMRRHRLAHALPSPYSSGLEP